MPARGTIVLPSPDTNTPDVPLDEHGTITPDWFGIPKGRCFTPTELAKYFRCDAKTIIRMIDEGVLEAFPFRIVETKEGRRVIHKIPYRAVAEYFMKMQGAMN